MYRTQRALHIGNELVNEYVHLLYVLQYKINCICLMSLRMHFALVLNLSVLMYLEFSPHFNVLLLYIICTLQGLAFQRKTYVHIHE